MLDRLSLNRTFEFSLSLMIGPLFDYVWSRRGRYDPQMWIVVGWRLVVTYGFWIWNDRSVVIISHRVKVLLFCRARLSLSVSVRATVSINFMRVDCDGGNVVGWLGSCAFAPGRAGSRWRANETGRAVVNDFDLNPDVRADQSRRNWQ